MRLSKNLNASKLRNRDRFVSFVLLRRTGVSRSTIEVGTRVIQVSVITAYAVVLSFGFYVT